MAGISTAAAQEIYIVVKKLQATNTITLGYRETLLPTSYLDDQKKPTGYAIEMCMRILDEVKAELKLPQIKVEYVPVNIQNRQALVANGTVQLECGGTVNTFARNKQVAFSLDISIKTVDTHRGHVLKKLGLRKFEDLNGKIVAVATGGSSEPELKHIIETNKLNVAILNVDDHAAGLIAVESRRADAYFNDNAAFFSLIKQSKNSANLAVVGPEYGYSPQGFMVPKNNLTFLWIVHHAMGKMFKSGEAEKIYDKWFGPFGGKAHAEAARRLGDAASVSRVIPGCELQLGLGILLREPYWGWLWTGLGWTLLLSLGAGSSRSPSASPPASPGACHPRHPVVRASTSRSSATSRRWSSCSCGTSCSRRWLLEELGLWIKRELPTRSS